MSRMEVPLRGSLLFNDELRFVQILRIECSSVGPSLNFLLKRALSEEGEGVLRVLEL